MENERRYSWKEEKNKWLKAERNVSFEDIIKAIDSQDDLIILEGTKNYPHQRRFVLTFNDYPHVVPFYYENGVYHLITIMADRRFKNLTQLKKHD